jgi:hypothetical protein
MNMKKKKKMHQNAIKMRWGKNDGNKHFVIMISLYDIFAGSGSNN